MQVLDFRPSLSRQAIPQRIIGTRLFDDEVNYMANLRKIGFACLAISCLQAPAAAQTCPPPPTSIDPSLSSSVSYDANTQTYSYHYTLRNGNGSMLPVNYFNLLLTEQPSNIH